MRALCASIITAGALIGLGLLGVGLGMRYQAYGLGAQSPAYIRMGHLDTPMALILVVLTSAVVIGLAAAFVGLAYHHERRHHERHHLGAKGEGLTSRLGE